MKNITTSILILIIVTGVTLVQPSSQHIAPKKSKPFGASVQKRSDQKRSIHSDRMDMLMAFKLTEELELTPEQAEVFFPLMKVHRKNLKIIDKKILELVNQFQTNHQNKDISDESLKLFIAKYSQLEISKQTEKERLFAEMEGILNNYQIFKLITFKQHFQRGMWEDLRKRKAIFRN